MQYKEEQKNKKENKEKVPKNPQRIDHRTTHTQVRGCVCCVYVYLCVRGREGRSMSSPRERWGSQLKAGEEMRGQRAGGPVEEKGDCGGGGRSRGRGSRPQHNPSVLFPLRSSIELSFFHHPTSSDRGTDTDMQTAIKHIGSNTRGPTVILEGQSSFLFFLFFFF